MPKIFDLVNAKAIGAYYSEVQSNAIPYMGTGLFPAKKQVGLDLSWIKGKGGLPVALKPSAFDTKATLRDRIGIQKLETEMPFFKEGMKIKEKDRQELLKLQNAGEPYVQPFIDRIYDDIKHLVDGATVQPERMIMQLLTNGQINISANGVAYTYDYTDDDYKTNHMKTLTGTDVWSDTTNSDPIDDINTACDYIEAETGTRPTRAIVSLKVWNYLKNNQKIKIGINGATDVAKAITNTQLQSYLTEFCGVTFVQYNKMFKDENGATKRFFAENICTLLPAGTLGNTYYGTTPEEADLMGTSGVDVSIVNTGVAIKTKKTFDPVNVDTIVSEIVLPSYERIDETFILTVAGA